MKVYPPFCGGVFIFRGNAIFYEPSEGIAGTRLSRGIARVALYYIVGYGGADAGKELGLAVKQHIAV